MESNGNIFEKVLIIKVRCGKINAVFFCDKMFVSSRNTKGADFDDGYLWGGVRLKQNIGQSDNSQGVSTPFIVVPLWVTFREYCRPLRAYEQVCPCLFITLALPVTNRSLQLKRLLAAVFLCPFLWFKFSVKEVVALWLL